MNATPEVGDVVHVRGPMTEPYCYPAMVTLVDNESIGALSLTVFWPGTLPTVGVGVLPQREGEFNPSLTWHERSAHRKVGTT